MFAELFEWLTTPCPPGARKLGYLREAIAITARHRRHRDRWASHLEASKALIEKAVRQAGSHRCAVVLGSGALLDVPLAKLVESFDRLELIDIVHPLRARHIAATYDRISLRYEDVTGAALALSRLGRNDRDPPLVGDLPILAPDTDFVVSANLLSQLPEIPLAWMAAKTAIPEVSRNAFARRLVRRHLDWLAGLECPVCLITDVERYYVEPDGTRLPAWDTLQGETVPPSGKTWTWDLAPAGESHRELAIQMTVMGYADFRPDLGAGAES